MRNDRAPRRQFSDSVQRGAVGLAAAPAKRFFKGLMSNPLRLGSFLPKTARAGGRVGSDASELLSPTGGGGTRGR